jgi:hypothetical protein
MELAVKPTPIAFLLLFPFLLLTLLSPACSKQDSPQGAMGDPAGDWRYQRGAPAMVIEGFLEACRLAAPVRMAQTLDPNGSEAVKALRDDALKGVVTPKVDQVFKRYASGVRSGQKIEGGKIVLMVKVGDAIEEFTCIEQVDGFYIKDFPVPK